MIASVSEVWPSRMLLIVSRLTVIVASADLSYILAV